MPATQSQAPARYRGLLPALLVIGVGIGFLLDNMGVDFTWLTHGWAWLVMLVAIVPLSRALHGYRSRGGFDAMVSSDLLNAAVIVMVAVIFLCDLPWAVWWPVFIIYGGMHMLVRRWNG